MTPEYLAIQREYGTRTTRRSGVPLIHHIDEGLAILGEIAAGDLAMRAYCLHPFIQADADLAANAGRLGELTTDPRVLGYAFEYRHVANAALSTRELATAADIALSPLAEVNAMLVADKVQNYKDFILYHRGSHPRSDALERYFRLWLERLGVAEWRFAELCAAIKKPGDV
ncbi:MAG: hypothetical protein ABI867_16635 [Kofleriaceae bacterium]